MDERSPLLKDEPPPTVSFQLQPPPKYATPPPQYSPPQSVRPPVTSPPAPGTLASFQLYKEPVCISCPNCHRQVSTDTEHVPGICLCIVVILGILLGVLLLALLVVVILFGGICWWCIPSERCCQSYMDVKHTCPHCGYEIGKFKRGC